MQNPTIRCNMCDTYFDDDDDLELIDVDGEIIQACPKCKTDAYLMDLQEVV